MSYDVDSRLGRILLGQMGSEMLARSGGYHGPSLGDEALKVEAPAESRAEIEAEVLRGYLLTSMLRRVGIRRSIRRECAACGKTISANKTHCAEHAA